MTACTSAAAGWGSIRAPLLRELMIIQDPLSANGLASCHTSLFAKSPSCRWI